MTHRIGQVTACTFIRNIEPEMDLCKLRIDFDEIFIFYDKDELNQFINQNVEYSTRKDMVDGVPSQVITDIAVMKTIQIVESTENIKLIPEGNKRTVCNFSISEVLPGTSRMGCVSFLSGVTRGSSNKTKWVDMKMIDMDSREFEVRMFTRDPNLTEQLDERVEAAIGTYVKYDVTYTRYGLQTDEITLLDTEVELSPEVHVAKAVIDGVIKSDKGLLELETVYHVTDNLLSIIDGEPGYMLVRMASEIYIINALNDISENLDIPTMKQAVICSRLYALPSNKKWSRPLLNVNKTSKVTALRQNDELMAILDPMSGRELSDTQRMYVKVRGMVNDIIKIRRGILDEEDGSIADVYSYVRRFNGLL